MKHSGNKNNSKTMIIMGLKWETLQLLALTVLVGFVKGSTAAERAQTGLANLNQQAFPEYPVQARVALLDSGNELMGQNQQLRPRQQEPLGQIESVPELLSAQRRYLFAGSIDFKDTDQDGRVTPTPQQQRRIQLDRILDSLSYDMLPSSSTASPIIYRSGRTYRAKAQRSELSSSPKQSGARAIPVDWVLNVDLASNNMNHGSPEQVLDLATQEVVSKPGAESSRLFNNYRANRYQANRRPFDKEEVMVIPHPSMHPRAVSDYDGFKRVENSRWNNLRGMWGKRSSLPAQQLLQSPADSETDERQVVKSM